MKTSIKFCEKCNQYMLQETCPRCNVKTGNPNPPKYSVEDKYASYRRKAKEEQRISQNLIRDET